MNIITAALAIAQVDRQVSPEEIEILDNLIDVELLGEWDRKMIMSQIGTKVDLKTAVDSVVNDPDRKHTLVLCFAMALAGGISPPESELIRKIAARWGYGQEVLAECLKEGQKVYGRIKGVVGV